MYAITGITGKVGSVVAQTLLSAGQTVRAVVRDAKRASVWAERGCELVIADMSDAAALTAAFTGVEAVFILPPSEFDPLPNFPEAREVIDAVFSALQAAAPSRVVCLSTIGAQATQSNLLTQRTLMEEALRALPLPLTFLRPGWFIENVAWDLASARETGVIHSFLQPTDKAIPMVATADVGRVAAELLMQPTVDTRFVELAGPCRLSPNDLAAALSGVVGHAVVAEPVARDTWESLFRAQGMQHPAARMRMLDGFNENWICFEGLEGDVIKGTVTLEAVLPALMAQSR